MSLEGLVAIASIATVATGAVTFMVRLWNKVENSLIKNTIALDMLVQEVSTLKKYEPRIIKAEQDIALIKQRCNYIQEAKKGSD